jgi:hypothetical protein
MTDRRDDPDTGGDNCHECPDDNSSTAAALSARPFLDPGPQTG